MIPKEIHYIWLGEKIIPEEIKKYRNSWKCLEKSGFKIHKWTDKELNLDKMPQVIKKAYEYKQYAFVRFRLLSASDSL